MTNPPPATLADWYRALAALEARAAGGNLLAGAADPGTAPADADDAAGAVLLRAHRRVSDGKAAPHEIAPRYLAVCTRNEARGLSRARARLTPLPDALPADPPEEDDRDDAHARRRAALYRLLPAALDALSPGRRRLLREHYWEEAGVAAMAARRGVRPGVVCGQLRAARAALRAVLCAALAAEGIDPPPQG